MRAQTGIGTLILMIAMILVAAVAAGVLIQTASSLQSKALATGSKASEAVATAVSVQAIVGNVSGPEVNHFTVSIRLAPGSSAIKFNETSVEVALSDAAQDYTYNSTLTGECNTVGSNVYNVKYLKDSANQRDDYLQPGDVVDICLIPPSGLGEGEAASLRIIPDFGQQVELDFSVTDTLVGNRVYLFP